MRLLDRFELFLELFGEESELSLEPDGPYRRDEYEVVGVENRVVLVNTDGAFVPSMENEDVVVSLRLLLLLRRLFLIVLRLRLLLVVE